MLELALDWDRDGGRMADRPPAQGIRLARRRGRGRFDNRMARRDRLPGHSLEPNEPFTDRLAHRATSLGARRRCLGATRLGRNDRRDECWPRWHAAIGKAALCRPLLEEEQRALALLSRLPLRAGFALQQAQHKHTLLLRIDLPRQLAEHRGDAGRRQCLHQLCHCPKPTEEAAVAVRCERR